MTLPSGFQTNVLTGLAVYLAAGGLEATWNTTGAYTALQTGIVLGNIPQAPDRIIALSAYGVGDDSPNLSDSRLGVQIRCRWGGSDPRPVDDLSDAIFSLLHGATHITLSTGAKIVQCLRNSGPVSLGQDANNRWSSVSNYYLSLWRPSTHRT
jgi:hypothetical protein